MKYLGGIAALLMIAPAIAAPEQQPTIAGNYKALAACAYKAFDGFIPGAFHLADLVDDIELTGVIPVKGVMFRTMKATFHKVADDVTALAVDDEGATTQRLYPVRSIATRCASKN
jgi:hypothetical protein